MMKFLKVFNFLLSFFLIQTFYKFTESSRLTRFPLTFGGIDLISADSKENNIIDENVIVMTIPKLIKMIGYNPNELLEATKTGDVITLRQFRSFLREKLSKMVSMSCFSDLLYFADSLLELGLAQYDLANRCIEFPKANCSCATAIDRSISENSWALDGNF